MESRHEQTSPQSSGITAPIDNLWIGFHETLQESEEEGHQQNSSQSRSVTTLIDNHLIGSHEALHEIPEEEIVDENNQSENRNVELQQEVLGENDIKKINYQKHSGDDLFTGHKHKRQRKE